ncbi:hypothetical protein DXG01_002401 [Tephrocybe rancida]|nr:hypothetical protein DXG01_002401 [Tephrocybe rancida]
MDTSPLKRTETFYGFEVPKEPTPPQDDECCMSNCAVCVYDLYEESLDDYRKSITVLRSALSTRGIPEDEWPKAVRSPTAIGPGDRKEVVLSAFEEMERALEKKRQTAEAQYAGH